MTPEEINRFERGQYLWRMGEKEPEVVELVKLLEEGKKAEVLLLDNTKVVMDSEKLELDPYYLTHEKPERPYSREFD